MKLQIMRFTKIFKLHHVYILICFTTKHLKSLKDSSESSSDLKLTLNLEPILDTQSPVVGVTTRQRWSQHAQSRACHQNHHTPLHAPLPGSSPAITGIATYNYRHYRNSIRHHQTAARRHELTDNLHRTHRTLKSSMVLMKSCQNAFKFVFFDHIRRSLFHSPPHVTP